jgi:hypothetical protein
VEYRLCHHLPIGGRAWQLKKYCGKAKPFRNILDREKGLRLLIEVSENTADRCHPSAIFLAKNRL